MWVMVDDRDEETIPQAPDGSTLLSLELDATRYKLLEMIGRGGMGEVVLAYDEHIGREVAVKRIRSQKPTEEEIARFVREARVQGRLEHPAVVPVHELATDRDGKPYFVMKRLSGTVMSKLLLSVLFGTDPDPAGTRRRMLRAFVDVCNAIELAHSQGVIHRDLKPANIMLGDFGEVYVLDWGIARAVSEPDEPSPAASADLRLATGETRAGTVLGTPAYMAPEQLGGERAGPAADLYALGCILYEIVAGVPLHPGKRTIATALAPVDARPSRVRPEAPPELDRLCTQATLLDPEERIKSARTLGAAVQAYLDGDRDVTVRQQLARDHLVEARAALAEGDHEHSRRAAMRAAGRALALDPTAHEAADLVTHLVLQPSGDAPAEVEQALEISDTRTAKQQGRVAAFSMIAYLGFVPFLIWTGVRDPTYVIAYAALALASSLQVYLLSRRNRLITGGIYLNACINAVLIGVVCRIVGPFLVAPALVATTLVAYAAHPRFGRIAVLSAILAAGIAVPWLLELAGVLAPTYSFDHGALIFRSPVIELNSLPVQLAFALILVGLLTVVALLSRNQALRQHAANRAVELQAWHLRQLVPSRDGG